MHLCQSNAVIHIQCDLNKTTGICSLIEKKNVYAIITKFGVHTIQTMRIDSRKRNTIITVKIHNAVKLHILNNPRTPQLI